MIRGYRLCIVVLGLALSCTNHAYAEGSKQQSQAEQSISKSLNDIATASRQQTERAQRADKDEAPCGQDEYGSKADLCAQWKAADAATDSARWAWIATISTIISTTAVLGAIYLAYQSNAIARNTAKHQLRAYVGLQRIEMKPLSSGAIHIQPVWKNSGQTPALRAMQNISYFIGDEEPRMDFLFPENIHPPQSINIYPGKELNVNGPTISSHDYKMVTFDNKFFMVYGWIEYSDIFPDTKKHRTEFCSRLVASNDGWGWLSMTRFNGVDETARPCITQE